MLAGLRLSKGDGRPVFDGATFVNLLHRGRFGDVYVTHVP